jgi:hypothetical protein
MITGILALPWAILTTAAALFAAGTIAVGAWTRFVLGRDGAAQEGLPGFDILAPAALAIPVFAFGAVEAWRQVFL